MGRPLLDVLRGERAEVENKGGRWLLWTPSRWVDGSSHVGPEAVQGVFEWICLRNVFLWDKLWYKFYRTTNKGYYSDRKHVYSHLYKCIIYGVVIVLIYVKYLSYVHIMDFL